MKSVWPVYGGLSFDLWNPDTGQYYDSVDSITICEFLGRKNIVDSNDQVLDCMTPRIAFRDVTNPTNTRTVVTALIPGNRVLVHTAPYLCQISGDVVDGAYVLGVLSSMPFDWQARRTIELHLTFAKLNSLSIPDPGQGHPVRDRVAEIAVTLATVDERFSEWANENGLITVPPPARHSHNDLLAELDACVGWLFGLDESELRVVYNTFGHSGQWDLRRDQVVGAFRRIGNGRS